MWWLLSIHDFIGPWLALKELVGLANLDRTFTTFLMLGILPGTNYQISFGDIICFIWLVIFTYISYRLFFKAQEILSHLDPYRHLSVNTTYLSLISL
jgi:hypothetical protein